MTKGRGLHRFRPIGALLLLAALFFFVAHAAYRPLPWGDHFWQVATGLDILETGVLPDRETRSYTVAGERWNNHEWGYEVLAAALWMAGGWGAVRFAVLLGMILAIVALLWRWRHAGLDIAIPAALAVTAASVYKFNPAPQALSFVLGLAGWFLFARPDLLDRPRRIVGLGAFCLVWGNISAECLSWVALLLCSQLQPLRERGRGRPALFLGLAVAMCLVSPPQSSILEYALVGTAINREVNTEFAHLWERPSVLLPSVRIAIVVGMTAWVGWAGARIARAPRGERLSESLRLLPGFAAVGAMVIYQRFASLVWIPIDMGIAAFVARGQVGLSNDRYIGGAHRWTGVVALALATGLGIAATRDMYWSPRQALADLSSPEWLRTHLDVEANPVGCAPALAALPAGTRVFSSRNWGNFLHMAAPQVRIFIDGRNREYPVVLHRMAAEAAAGGPGTAAILDGSGTDVVLADPDWRARAGLEASWEPQTVAPHCAVFVRRRPTDLGDATVVPRPPG